MQQEEEEVAVVAAVAADVDAAVVVIRSPLPYAVVAAVATVVKASEHHSQTVHTKYLRTFHSVIFAKD